MENRVLELGGDGDHVQLPTNIFNNLEEATVECWVKWKRFAYFSQPFGFGKATQMMAVNNCQQSPDLQFFIYVDDGRLKTIRVHNVLRLDQWCHIAAVSGARTGMKLYFNGMLVGEDPFTCSFAAIKGGEENYLGRSQWAENEHFCGQLDEFRVWSGSRTQAQIQETMGNGLTGREAGLVGLWNFDAGDGRDSAPNGFGSQLMGNARCVEEAPPHPSQLTLPALVSGRVTDAAGKPLVEAAVRVEQYGTDTPEGAPRAAIEELTDVGACIELRYTRQEGGVCLLGGSGVSYESSAAGGGAVDSAGCRSEPGNQYRGGASRV